MRIVIAGAGDLGTYLVEKLSSERHDLCVIDKSGEKLENLSQKHDVATLKGGVLSYDNLISAQVSKADLFVAVTDSEELNLMSAILAKRMGSKRVLARVRQFKLVQHDDVFDFAGLGIDEVISPDALVADEITMLIGQKVFSHLVKFEHGRYLLAGISVTDEESVLIGRTPKQLASKYLISDVVPIAVIREGMTKKISDNLKIELGDQLYFLTTQSGVSNLVKLKSHHRRSRHRAMVLGGSRAGIETARRLLDKGYQVSVVEGNREVAEDLADILPEALVVYGDMQEPGFLEEQDVGEMDAVIAATGNPELNIISCLTAKELGVHYTIAFVNDANYLKRPHTFGVDTLINKKFIAADFIVRHVKKRNVLSVVRLPELNMEVFEFVVKEQSPITNMPVSKVDLINKGEVVVGGVLRNRKVFALDKTYSFKPGDRVIVACHEDKREQFHKLL